MARETRSSFIPRGDPRKGAAEAAPTAPHATAPTKRDTSGPARFWNASRVRVLFVLILLACALHAPLSPWDVDLGFKIEAKDVDGELTIPVDLVSDDEPAKKEEPEPAPVGPGPTDKPGPNARDGGPIPRDAGHDAESLATDAAVPNMTDGSAPTDAGVSDGGDLDGAIAAGDAGATPGSGAKDAAGLIGLKSLVDTGPQNIVLVVNVAAIRSHPLASRIGNVLVVIPQWRDFLNASNTPFNPVQQTEWIFIYGPSLRHTDRDAILIRYNAPDAVVDAVVDAIAKRANDKHEPGGPFGPYDAGVPGVRATTGHADNAARVFLRPAPGLLVIAPPKHATAAAKAYRTVPKRPSAANEALRLTVKNPSQQVTIPFLKFSDHLKELRLWIVPDSGGGADVFVEGDCDDEIVAPQIAQELTDLLKDLNSKGVQLGPFKVTVSTTTKHLLDNAVVNADGKHIELHVKASPEQLDAVLRAVESSPLTQP
ncbi:MAG TPA: hypothetical protein VIF62_23725 [Labilithrix sp.]